MDAYPEAELKNLIRPNDIDVTRDTTPEQVPSSKKVEIRRMAAILDDAKNGTYGEEARRKYRFQSTKDLLAFLYT